MSGVSGTRRKEIDVGIVVEEICTEEFAKEQFYEKLLEKDGPLLFDDNGDLYVLGAEMPDFTIGEIKEVIIIENQEDLEKRFVKY